MANIYRNVKFNEKIDIYTINDYDNFEYTDSDSDSDSNKNDYKPIIIQPKIIKNNVNNSYVFKENFIKTKYFWWRF
jgi:hypothetical protein